MRFIEPQYILYFAIVLLILIRLFFMYRWKKRAQNKFAQPKFQQKVFHFSNLFQFIGNSVLLAVIVSLIVLALMDLIGNTKETKIKLQGADVALCLDLSNSMNAEDVSPSRLGKAKLILKSLLEQTDERFSLTVFADKAYTVVPLTQDYEAINNYIDIAEPELVFAQGTSMHNALEKAIKSLDNSDLTSKTIVLISDGEDHEEKINSVVDLAKEKNVSIISIGVGTSKGSTIPEFKNYNRTGLITHNGTPVISRYTAGTLKKLASETRGLYLYGDNPTVSAQNIQTFLSKADQNTQETLASYVSDHYYQWFVGFALLLLIIISLTNIRSEFNI